MYGRGKEARKGRKKDNEGKKKRRKRKGEGTNGRYCTFCYAGSGRHRMRTARGGDRRGKWGKEKTTSSLPHPLPRPGSSIHILLDLPQSSSVPLLLVARRDSKRRKVRDGGVGRRGGRVVPVRAVAGGGVGRGVREGGDGWILTRRMSERTEETGWEWTYYRKQRPNHHQ
jgi:hypothetical protein